MVAGLTSRCGELGRLLASCGLEAKDARKHPAVPRSDPQWGVTT